MRILNFKNTHPGIKDFKRLYLLIKNLYTKVPGLRFELIETKKTFSIRIYWVKSKISYTNYEYLKKQINVFSP